MTSKTGYHIGFWQVVCGALALGTVLLWASSTILAQGTPGYTVLHTFTGADGEYPSAGLVQDRAGNLYSTAFLGGDLNQCGGSGCGVVFKLDTSNNETVLYSFEGGTDGAGPAMGLFRDWAGNLYSTTHTGGDVGGCTGPGFPSAGCGVAFKVDPAGSEAVVHAFTGGAAGLGPASGLVRDEAGNLYGTTGFGGFNGDCPLEGIPGCGVVFKVDPSGKETVLHTFTGGADGYSPYGNLLMDAAGDLYGTAVAGGDVGGYCSDVAGALGCGTVYKLDRSGKFTVLYTFHGADGAGPNGFLVPDNAGNLYGMTFYGGDLNECSGLGCGAVFKLDSSGKESLLYRFKGGADGAEPYASVIRDAAGNLYGTANYGGEFSGSLCAGTGCGVAFKLDPTGKETVLYTFTGGADGANPEANLLQDEEGNLYGTASGGGDPTCQCGVVFKVGLHGGEHN